MTSASFAIKHSKNEIAAELYLPFWFCFYAHDNYITLEKAKLVITRNKQQNKNKSREKNELEVDK